MAQPWYGTAGDVVEFDCPTGTQPIYTAGTFYPNEKEATLYILEVKGNHYVLGPIQAGKFEGIDLCGSSPSPGALNYELMLPPQSQMPKPIPPAPPMNVGFPWAWLLMIVLILLAIASVLLGSVYFWRLHQKKKLAQPKKKKIVLTPEEQLKAWVQQQRDDPKRYEEDLALQKDIFDQGWHRLRKYLEQRFQVQAPGATSREFPGELKAALIVWKQRNPQDRVPENLVPRVETLISQSQAAVYSQTRFDAAVVKSFIEQIRSLHRETAKVTEAVRDV
jgi:hypothetical protein